MAIKKPVSNDLLSTFVHSIDVFDCYLPGVTKACNITQHSKLKEVIEQVQ